MCSRFPKKNEGEVVFYLKSLELQRVRTIVGFVEQNMASKVKALTRKNKQKSQGKGKTLKKNTWSKREPSFLPQYYPRLRWKRQALGSAPVLENLR